MNAPEDNPADEQQPTKEEWEAYERQETDAYEQRIAEYGTPAEPK